MIVLGNIFTKDTLSSHTKYQKSCTLLSIGCEFSRFYIQQDLGKVSLYLIFFFYKRGKCDTEYVLVDQICRWKTIQNIWCS